MALYFTRLIVFLSFVILLSCTISKENTVKKYGFVSGDEHSSAVTIELEKYNDFDALLEHIEKISCHDSIPVIEIVANRIIKHIVIDHPCMQKIACRLVKNRNDLSIKDDAIHVADIYHIEKLDSLLIEHYTNLGKEPYFSDRPADAMVSISYFKNECSNLGSILENITLSYDRMNIEVPLNIRLNKEIPPPNPIGLI